MGVTIVLAFVLLSLVLWCAIHRIRQIGAPGFKTWPLIGVTLEVAANYHRIYDWILWNFNERGTMTEFASMPGRTYVFTVDPANVEHVLKTSFTNYPKGGEFHQVFEPLLGNGIFNSDGQSWKIQRKTASFEFASRTLRDVSCRVFQEHALKLAGIVGDRCGADPLELQDLFMRMTLDTICNLGFGVQLGVLSPTLPRNDFATAFDKCNEIVSYRFADPLWKMKRFLRLGQERHLARHLKAVDDFTHKIIRRRRIQLQNDSKHHQHDLLSRFMLLDDHNFSDNDLRDIVLNFVIAGRDTTASTLTYFIYMIASHPESAARIYQELREFESHLQRRQPDQQQQRSRSSEIEINPSEQRAKFMQFLTYESLAKLVYLQAALMETLRLYPAVPLNFKSVVADDVFPSGDVVRKGMILSYAPYCMARMKQIWGCDAAEFRPERWRKDGEWEFGVSPFKFTAFQAGPRICLGKESAYLQMKITAALLCRFFEFTLVPGQNLHYRVMATISLSQGLKVTTSQRAY